MHIYIDGKFYDKENAKISVFDHGLLYGDGVFEGIRVYHRKVFKLKEHIDRLYDSAKVIMLQIPMSRQEMMDAVLETCRKNDVYENGYIRLIVTRGMGDLGLDIRKCANPSIIIIATSLALYPRELYEKGLEIVTVATRRNLAEAVNPSIKSLNYLNNIMAKVEAINAGAEEAIMLNQEGFVSECTGDNIFIIKRGKLLTPPSYMGILEGITRNVVMKLAEKDGLLVEETTLTRYDIYTAEECFLTGSAAEIIPVVKVDNRVIGEGRVGKITTKLLGMFKAYVKKDGTAIPEEG
jgi:branched-chain amino acid aminotransferase